MIRARLLLALATTVAGGCAERGSVTFSVREPSRAEFSPLRGPIQFEIATTDGELIGAATEGRMSSSLLPLGALAVTPMPVDLVMRLFSGPALFGMARIRDVTIRAGVSRTFEAHVRKPLVFVGSTLPSEGSGNQLAPGMILDPTTGQNLADPLPAASPSPSPAAPPKLPDGISASAVTSDGRFLLAGRRNALTVWDTGSGEVVGEVSLSFTPVRVAVATRDLAAVALDGGGQVALFNDVAALTSRPTSTPPMLLPLGQMPRKAVFSPDGSKLYVLTGGAVDPCEPGASPPANAIVTIGLDGMTLATWTMPDFVSDLAVDATTGTLVLAQSTGRQVSTLAGDAPAGPIAPQRMFSAVCPSAVTVSRGTVLAVTSERDTTFENAFVLKRGRLGSTAATNLAFTGPLFRVPTGDMPTPDGNTGVHVEMVPGSITAYEMAVTPDGERLVFATRAHYRQNMEALTIITLDCVADLDIVEYGLFQMDVGTGNSSYQARAQAVRRPASDADPCITCDLGLFLLGMFCPPGPGDRPAGISAIFGGP